MNFKLQELMRAATRLTQGGRLQEATQMLRRAFHPGMGSPPPPSPPAPHPVHEKTVLDGLVRELDDAPRAVDTPPPHAPEERPAPFVPAEHPGPAGDTFVGGSFSHAAAGTRGYKLFVPARATAASPPLVVMLHGCKQNPDDFAAGTGMNALAREQGVVVLYPEQSMAANPSGCWRWFMPGHQQRDRGEPALLVGMVREVMAAQGIDPRRVYVAGLSAGGAMAAILAQAYPDVFAAAGIHSGLPSGSAQDVMSALSVMKSGQAGTLGLPTGGLRPAAPVGTGSEVHVPTIVFHGDADATVHPRNGEQLMTAAMDAARQHVPDGPGGAAEPPRVERGQAAQGRHYTRTAFASGPGRSEVEHWLVHGSGHAWSGGQAAGSYTDPQGPNASREMLRFFLAHPRPVTH